MAISLFEKMWSEYVEPFFTKTEHFPVEQCCYIVANSPAEEVVTIFL